MRIWLAVIVFTAVASAQSFEAAFSGGVSRFGSSNVLGTASGNPSDPQKYKMNDGFRLTLRMALNTYRFFGHEFGYSYNHTSIAFPATTTVGLPGQPVSTVPAQDVSVPIHQGFYDFLVYATPEGKR